MASNDALRSGLLNMLNGPTQDCNVSAGEGEVFAVMAGDGESKRHTESIRLTIESDIRIPVGMQADLGTMRIGSYVSSELQSARDALGIFDSRRQDGVRTQHRCILKNYLLADRVTSNCIHCGSTGKARSASNSGKTLFIRLERDDSLPLLM